MKTSLTGINLIKKNEGCVLTAYLDRLASPSVWTIGYGETGDYVYQGLVYTQEEAEEGLLRRLANEFEPGVMKAIGDALTIQSQFDAMISLEWNIGVGRFARSSVARYHRTGNYKAAANAFRLWNKAGGRVLEGLVRRREEERQLYLGIAPVTIRDIQARLNTLGENLVVDGIAGQKTLAAILTHLK